MLAISLVVGSFLVVGALLLGTMLGWVLREYMMYHHDKNNHGARTSSRNVRRERKCSSRFINCFPF